MKRVLLILLVYFPAYVFGQTIYDKNKELFDSIFSRVRMSDLSNYKFIDPATVNGSNPFSIANTAMPWPAPQAGTLLHLVSDAAGNARIQFDVYNSANIQGGFLQFRRSIGPKTAPSAPDSGYVLGGIGGDGYGTTGFHGASSGVMTIRAEATHTQTSAPSYFSVGLAPSGSIQQVERFRVRSNGQIYTGAQSGSTAFFGAGRVAVDANGFWTSSPITGAEVNSALGYTPQASGNYITASKYTTDSTATQTALAGKQASGNYALNSRVDSVATALNGKANTSVLASYKLITDSGRGTSQYVTGGTLKKVIDSLAPTYNNAPGRLLSTGANNIYTNGNYWNYASYNVKFAYALTALLSASGIVELQYSTDNGSTWNSTGGKASWGCTVCVLVTGSQDNQITGTIPPNAKFRIYQSANTNVTVTLPTTGQFEKYSAL